MRKIFLEVLAADGKKNGGFSWKLKHLSPYRP